MPYADTAATARSWARDRAIDAWVVFASDLDAQTAASIRPGIDAARADGAQVAVVIAGGDAERSGPATGLQAGDGVDAVVRGPEPPLPFGLLDAMRALGIADVRRVGVLGTTRAVLDAGHRAGFGAIVGI